MNQPKLYRYYLPSIQLEGWAEIVVCSTGMFAAVSDYGNYAEAWRAHGFTDFREFLLRAERDWDYFANRLCDGRRDYDGDATLLAVKREILRARREGDWTREEARCEWDNLSESSPIDDFRDWLESRERLREAGWPVAEWADIYQEALYRIPRQVEAFCKRVMPRLCAMIRAELEAERKEVA